MTWSEWKNLGEIDPNNVRCITGSGKIDVEIGKQYLIYFHTFYNDRVHALTIDGATIDTEIAKFPIWGQATGSWCMIVTANKTEINFSVGGVDNYYYGVMCAEI